MYYYIYKTTNLINGKYYIGAHQSKSLEDEYLGSGTALRKAIRKYGRENFKREILFTCNSKKEMFEKEAEVVDANFIKKKDTYNLREGGQGGIETKYRKKGVQTQKLKSIGIFSKNAIAKRNAINKQNKSGIYNITKEKRLQIQKASVITCKNLQVGIFSKESRSKAAKANKALFTGGKFLNNGITSKRAKKEEIDSLLSQGWTLGRLPNKSKLVGTTD